MPFATNHEMLFATKSGQRIHYQVAGRGPPLVRPHGFTGSVNGWRRHGYVGALRGDCRVIP